MWTLDVDKFELPLCRREKVTPLLRVAVGYLPQRGTVRNKGNSLKGACTTRWHLRRHPSLQPLRETKNLSSLWLYLPAISSTRRGRESCPSCLSSHRLLCPHLVRETRTQEQGCPLTSMGPTTIKEILKTIFYNRIDIKLNIIQAGVIIICSLLYSYFPSDFKRN